MIPILLWTVDTLDAEADDELVALYRRLDERLAAIEYNPLASSPQQAANLARNEARNILRAEFADAGVDVNQ